MLASKPQVGHCLGAAGAVELAICCESMRRGILPPFAPDSNMDFERPGQPVGPAAIRRSVHSILKIVAGFGGHVEVCLLEKLADH
jgi:3-oxoacyl-(acyl-carrier-protein) synthase